MGEIISCFNGNGYILLTACAGSTVSKIIKEEKKKSNLSKKEEYQ